MFQFWFYTRTDQSDPCMSVCSCSGSTPGQTSQTPVCLSVRFLVLYQDRPVRLMYVCVFLFWFYTRTDQSDPCMSECSFSGYIPGQTSQTPVCLCVPVLVLYQSRPVRPCMSVSSGCGSIQGQTNQTPVCLCVPVLVLYKDRPIRPLYVCVFLFSFYARTDQSDPCMSECSFSGSKPGQTSSFSSSIAGQTSQTPASLYFLFWFYFRTDQSDPCMSVCSCSGSIPRQTSQSPVCL